MYSFRENVIREDGYVERSLLKLVGSVYYPAESLNKSTHVLIETLRRSLPPEYMRSNINLYVTNGNLSCERWPCDHFGWNE